MVSVKVNECPKCKGELPAFYVFRDKDDCFIITVECIICKHNAPEAGKSMEYSEAYQQAVSHWNRGVPRKVFKRRSK